MPAAVTLTTMNKSTTLIQAT